MEFIKKNKNILLGAAILILVFTGYGMWSRNSSSNDSSSGLTFTDSPIAVDTVGGQEILNVLNQLRHLSIDSSIFESPAFLSLMNYTVATSSEPLGRPDPFAPLPATSTKTQ